VSPASPRGGRGPFDLAPPALGPFADLPHLHRLRFVAQRPEPERFWVRHAPRGWEGPARPWLDLAAGHLGRLGRGGPEIAPPAGEAPARRALGAVEPARGLPAEAAEADCRASDEARSGAAGGEGPALDGAPGEVLRAEWPELCTIPFDDLVYLPPVPPHVAAERDALARLVLAGGAPVLVQLLPGDLTTLADPRTKEPDAPGLVFVVDLLATLLDGGLAGARAVPMPARAAAAAWPLVPGLTDDRDVWEAGCRTLAAAGLHVVQAMVPALAPGDRRRLAEEAHLGEDRAQEAFEALFHRPPHLPHSPHPAHSRQAPNASGSPDPPPPPDLERELARLAWRHGLAPFLRRPAPRPPLHGAGNRRAAGLLALVAELWLRVGRPVEQAQSLFRAVRWLDDTSYDIEALCREGNLAVLTALDPLARQIVADAAGPSDPPLLAELLAEYLAPNSRRPLPPGGREGERGDTGEIR
jgi:hypothetical protein